MIMLHVVGHAGMSLDKGHSVLAVTREISRDIRTGLSARADAGVDRLRTPPLRTRYVFLKGRVKGNFDVERRGRTEKALRTCVVHRMMNCHAHIRVR